MPEILCKSGICRLLKTDEVLEDLLVQCRALRPVAHNLRGGRDTRFVINEFNQGAEK